MILDTSIYGAVKGAVKTAEVFAWVAASGGVAALAAYVSGFNVTDGDLKKLAVIAVINALLAGAAKWLKAVNPGSVSTDVSTEPVAV